MGADDGGLLARWTGPLGPAAEPAGRELLDRWAEPHRHHHDRRHLTEVLDAVDELTGGDPPTAVVLAAWFHDAVYEGRAGEDERASAALAARVLPALAPALVDEVVRLVLLTASHRPEPGDDAGALLCDADLSVLAAPPERYASYVQGVRQEYAHVGDAAFRSGRAQVLRALLGGPLFHTPAAADRWEARARAQVAAEVQRLTGPDGGAEPRPAEAQRHGVPARQDRRR